MKEQKPDALALTRSVILKPLRNALEEHDINEDNIIKIFSEILNDKEQPGATRLKAIQMFLDMLGLVHSVKDNINVEVTHKIGQALDELEAKRLARIEKKETKLLEAEYVSESREDQESDK